MVLNPAVFSLKQTIEKLIDIVQIQIEEKKLHFETQIEIPNTYLIADELRLNQVFINILTNAIKYTPEGGTISMYGCRYEWSYIQTCGCQKSTGSLKTGKSKETGARMMKKNKSNGMKLLAVISAGTLAAGLIGCGTKTSPKTDATETKTEGFVPSLDTEKSVSLETAGCLGNFEALDQVINAFNEYYPNVTITYEQNDMQALADYLKNNSYVDFFMTSDANVRSKDQENLYVYDNCLNLAEQDIDTSSIDPELIKAGTVDGKLVRLPLARLMCGLTVNKTLLEKEGLEIPQTYEEFLSVCKTLKAKGYTPIQSSKFHACSDLVLPMAMSILGNSKELTAKIQNGDTSYADSLIPVYEKLDELLQNGYISSKVNDTYPDDNYDGAILKFFEGDVPFWVTTTESFGGMKKRESKSEAFSADPFEYEFINAPLGDDGSYDYEEPWYGFSVNKDSEELDYAVEFMKFLAQTEEMNKLAETKGMPSATIDNHDERFQNALHPEKEAGRYVYNSEIGGDVTSAICDCANQFGRGETVSVDEVIEAIKERGLNKKQG